MSFKSLTFYEISTLLKKVSDFPVPSRDVTNQTLPGLDLFQLFLPRESLVSDIPAGDGKISNLFYSAVSFLMKHLESLYEQLSNKYQAGSVKNSSQH